MTRPRRPTIAPSIPATADKRPSDRITVGTDPAIASAIPAKFATCRDKIISIVHTIKTSPDKDSHRRLIRYLDELEANPEIAAAHQREITNARKALAEVLDREWKVILDATQKHEILRPMLFNLR